MRVPVPWTALGSSGVEALKLLVQVGWDPPVPVPGSSPLSGVHWPPLGCEALTCCLHSSPGLTPSSAPPPSSTGPQGGRGGIPATALASPVVRNQIRQVVSKQGKETWWKTFLIGTLWVGLFQGFHLKSVTFFEREIIAQE